MQEIARGAQQAAAEHAQRASSLAPSLQNWLGAGEAAAPRSPQGAEGGGAAGIAGALQPQLQQHIERPPKPGLPNLQTQPSAGAPGSTPFATHPIGLPPRPTTIQHAPLSATQLTPGAHAKVLANRPASRSRRRPGSAEGRSSGRGWTAFTAFGISHRDSIREANPWASATEIERLLGKQWASLLPEEKQHYVDVAAEVRKSSLGNYPMGAMGMAGVGSGELMEGIVGEGGEGGGGLRRTRSDVGNEERQVRPTRRPRAYGPEYDTSDAPWGVKRKGSLGGAGSLENELDKVYAEILAAEEAERLGVPGNGGSGGGKKGGIEEEREDEADVLGVLADMRAEVLASESAEKSAERGDDKVVGGENLQDIEHEKQAGGEEITAREPAVLDGASEKMAIWGNGEEAHSLPTKEEQ